MQEKEKNTNQDKYLNRITNPTVKKIVKSEKPSHTDPNGSYTGIPYTENAEPTQDADDL